MAIPGHDTKYEVRAKVRIGKKMGARPASVDHFLSDDPELTNLFGSEPKQIRIRFPYQDADEAFSTGLEWWVKTNKGANQLACYTKGEREGLEDVALRLPPYVNPEDKVLGETNSGRVKIVCPNRACPIFKEKKKCKPMGRLIFFLDGGRTDKMLELDTKSWNSIEKLEPVLQAAGDLRGRVWTLSVAFESKGNKRFPVLSIEEADVVQVNTPQEVTKADALLPLLAAATDEGADDAAVRSALATALDVTNPGWRDNQAFIDRIKEVGVRPAAEGLLKTNELWPT